MLRQIKSRPFLLIEMRNKVFLCILSTLVGFILCYYLFTSDYTSVSDDYLIVNLLNGRNIRSANLSELETHPTIHEDPLPTVAQENISSQVHLNTTPIHLPIVGQTILCPTSEEPKTIPSCPSPSPTELETRQTIPESRSTVYWASSPKEVSDQRRYITASFSMTGGIGNMIWRFASLYGMGRTLGREVYWDGRNVDQMAKMSELAEVFPLMHEKLHIKFPFEFHIAGYYALDCCKYDNPKKIENITAQYIRVGGDYLQSYKFFHQYRDEIRQIFQCGPRVMKRVEVAANLIFGNDKRNTHLLCAHIRRGDFLKDLMLESKKDFVEPAIEYAFNYLQEKGHNNISLFFIGTDLPFINDLDLRNLSFSMIYNPAILARGDDMCLAINYCDSMIMTASGSTYGWWISYLMPANSTIFYNSQVTDHASFTKDVHDYDIFLDEWIKLTVYNETAHREKWWWYQRHNWSREKADGTCE